MTQSSSGWAGEPTQTWEQVNYEWREGQNLGIYMSMPNATSLALWGYGGIYANTSYFINSLTNLQNPSKALFCYKNSLLLISIFTTHSDSFCLQVGFFFVGFAFFFNFTAWVMDANTNLISFSGPQGIFSKQVTLRDALCKWLQLLTCLLLADLPEPLYNLPLLGEKAQRCGKR